MSSAAIPSPVPRAVLVTSHPVRAALCGVVFALGLGVVSVLIAHRVGALHIPVHGAAGQLAREAMIAGGASLLALFGPLLLAVRQSLVGRRAAPLLLAAALGPVVVLATLAVMMYLPAHLACRCGGIN